MKQIEQTGNVSNELKEIANELDVAIVLITSVNKQGMDSQNDIAVKSNMRGSGQQIHDADVIYTLTKLNSSLNDDMTIKPDRYPNIVSLHVSAARELDHHIKGGFINYERMKDSPKVVELKDVKELPAWIDYNERGVK